MASSILVAESSGIPFISYFAVKAKCLHAFHSEIIRIKYQSKFYKIITINQTCETTINNENITINTTKITKTNSMIEKGVSDKIRCRKE